MYRFSSMTERAMPARSFVTPASLPGRAASRTPAAARSAVDRNHRRSLYGRTCCPAEWRAFEVGTPPDSHAAQELLDELTDPSGRFGASSDDFLVVERGAGEAGGDVGHQRNAHDLHAV